MTAASLGTICLMSCPFCGSEATATNYVTEAAVVCDDCRATITRAHGPHDDTGYPAAFSAWNRRPGTAASLGAVDRLTELRAKVRRNAEGYAQANADAKVAECRAQERALTAAIAALTPAVGGVEPVAWRWWNGTGWEYGERTPVSGGGRARPLYAAPAPPPAATCTQYRPGAPCPTPASCRDNGCSAVEREQLAAPLVDDAMVERAMVALVAYRNTYRTLDRDGVRAALQAALSAAPCPCNAPTCAEPWEPGCGLGTSEAHAAPAVEELTPEDHRKAASIDAMVYGTGYLVNGRHVAPDRVQMVIGKPAAAPTPEGGETAPWPDFAGNPIRDKDRIRHPDGTTATVLHLPAMGEGGEAWRVVYEDGCLSRLSLQIGDKGMAVVIQQEPRHDR